MCKSEDCLKGLKLVKFTKISCDDFLVMGLRYQHIDPPSPDVDYIAIRLDLRDTRSGSIYQVSFQHFCYYFVSNCSLLVNDDKEVKNNILMREANLRDVFNCVFLA